MVVCAVCVNGQGRIDSNGETVWHDGFVTARWQICDFDYTKSSSIYSLGVMQTSVSHWGAFHVGFDVNVGFNAGLVKNSDFFADFGPSVRLDICKNVLFNMPINALCDVSYSGTKTHTFWGINLLPALHLFASDKFGIFVGPQFLRYFEGDKFYVGMNMGLSYTF